MKDTVPPTTTFGGLQNEVGWSLTLAGHQDIAHLGKRLALRAGSSVVLGRAQECFGVDVLNDERTSRNHAAVDVQEDGTILLRDLGSRNGTAVNGRRIDKAHLSDGDVIGLGRILLLVHRAPALYRVRQHQDILGVSHKHAEIIEQIEKAAPHTTNVLLCGETGTGKDLIAAEIHRRSGRDGRFVTLDCGALPEALVQSELFGYEAGAFPGAERGRTGLLEQGAGGTILLDSVADASASLQSSLLRFLESGEIRRLGAAEPTRVDARVIAASRSDIEPLVQSGVLRKDFALRLGGWVIKVPPLRERREDIPLLAAHFVRRYAGVDVPLHHKLALRLIRHDWPGNVRELESAIERAVIEADGRDPIPLSQPLESLLIGNDPPIADSISHLSIDAPSGVLILSPSWFQIGHERVDLEKRRSLCLVYQALCTQRRENPGEPLSLTDLLAAGWPGEQVLERAGANRVYVALTTLRKMGLRDLLMRNDEGYLIDPKVPIQLVDW